MPNVFAPRHSEDGAARGKSGENNGVVTEVYRAVRRSMETRRSIDIAHVGLKEKGISSRNIPDVYVHKDGLSLSRRTSEVMKQQPIEEEKGLNEVRRPSQNTNAVCVRW